MNRIPYSIMFNGILSEYFSKNKHTKLLRCYTFETSDKSHRDRYEYVMNTYKRWVYHQNSFRLSDGNKVLVYVDYDRFKMDYSILLGNNPRTVDVESIKPGTKVKSLEELIHESFKEQQDKPVDKVIDNQDIYNDFLNEMNRSWKWSFVLNSIPSIQHGNYLNIPKDMIIIDKLEFHSFKDDFDYTFRYLNRFPMKITELEIDDVVYINIVNTSVVPIFLEMDFYYVYYM